MHSCLKALELVGLQRLALLEAAGQQVYGGGEVVLHVGGEGGGCCGRLGQLHRCSSLLCYLRRSKSRAAGTVYARSVG
jgi:hypothetical protein